MSKGSKRRPGTGYEDGWERIFGQKKPEPKESPEKREEQDKGKE